MKKIVTEEDIELRENIGLMCQMRLAYDLVPQMMNVIEEDYDPADAARHAEPELGSDSEHSA